MDREAFADQPGPKLPVLTHYPTHLTHPPIVPPLHQKGDFNWMWMICPEK